MNLQKTLVAALVALTLSSCAHKPAPVITAPEWDVIPAGVVEALCQRLQMDAIATGALTIVRVTQPLATPEIMMAVAEVSGARRPSTLPGARIENRAIPIATMGGSCAWQPIDVRDLPAHHDEMVAEMSAPMLNPFAPREAGLIARVALGGENPNWYWISLVPTPTGGWGVRFVSVLYR